MIRPIPGLPSLCVIARVVWPLPWPLAARIGAVAILLAASQYHQWSRPSSGSVFAPEFPRPIVILFNVAFGAIALLAVMPLVLDVAVLASLVLPGGGRAILPAVRYAEALAAILLEAIGVHQAVRVPPLRTIEMAIKHLPPDIDGYTVLHDPSIKARAFVAALRQVCGTQERLELALSRPPALAALT